MFTDSNVVSVYTRAQALADGVLVDVSSMAKEAGFKVPMAMTAAAWAEAVAWREIDEKAKSCGQSEDGRLWDVLVMAHVAATSTEGDRAKFSVLRVSRDSVNMDASKLELVLHIGPGDHFEPVCTVMMVGED